MTECRPTDDGYLVNDEHYDDCETGDCQGCWPCVPKTENGDPLKHCTARGSCTEHVKSGILTCITCLSKTRNRVRRIVELTPLLPVAAVESGSVDSPAVNLAGPAASPAGWSDRKVEAIRDGTVDTLPDDDPEHPYAVLGRWQMMLEDDPRECYPVDRDPITVAGAADYLNGVLAQFAQDDEQDFPLFVREGATCLNRIKSVLAVAQQSEKGAPCPTCSLRAKAPRLVLHHDQRDRSGASDRWQCPDVKGHRWTDAEYRMRVGADYLEHADKLTARQMAEQYDVKEGSVRGWAAKETEDGEPLVRKRGKDHNGLTLYDVADVRAVKEGRRKAAFRDIA